ncbi:alpha/beta hydrolase-fold protein [Corynebacterium caspium]|uniref:alpha/beta hydrolase-fold protein n=1 Tax=Corynebacterium caspium TaxID=234828 RepID=UPI00037B515C|nr:alpha/beta hydrolase-fold protein [Corynebacterium caspium]WKD59983.1 Diacylglycerol acyltransferase/mycolyltransferase Ag85B precursor [Corynebacterium caspium DSM 44850]
MRDTTTRVRRPLILATSVVLGASLLLPQAASAQGLSSNLSGSLNSDAIRPSDPDTAPPTKVDHPTIAGLPAGVAVQRVEWLTNRRVALWITSAAMPEHPIQVQMLLARDWHSHPEKKFPEVWALDGLRAREDENGWTIETNIEQYFADKNVNVILPVGGESSFYSDWKRPDNGKNYKWESFLINELIPVLREGYRSNGDRAIVGLSMGGTAAVNLAERHPDLFKFVGSFSGYLDTTSVGMQPAIAVALNDAGGYDANAMWGLPDDPAWAAHDPKLNIAALKNMSVYVSAGSGRDDFGTAASVAKGRASLAGIGLEAISRMTTQTFVNQAKRDGVAVTSFFRPSGVHSWEYWQFEMQNAWPFIADALKLSVDDRGANCLPVGAIAEATKTGIIGTCTNNEYDIAGGKAEDFRKGTAYWSAETGAFALFGRINARYSEMGGPASWLGFPVTTELSTPDGKGRFVHFQRGSIYWTPELGPISVPGDIVGHWGTANYERGDLGYPVADAKEIAGGLVQEFERGLITRKPDGSNAWVRGAIAAKYRELNTATSPLGFPTSDEKLINGGAFQQFEHGNIYWSAKTGAQVVMYGDIFNTWGTHKWEQGEFGYPTKDTATIPAGGLVQEFEHGTIKQVNGLILEEKR